MQKALEKAGIQFIAKNGGDRASGFEDESEMPVRWLVRVNAYPSSWAERPTAPRRCSAPKASSELGSAAGSHTTISSAPILRDGEMLDLVVLKHLGVKVVYEKNKNYMPRKEPPSWTSGGKVVKIASNGSRWRTRRPR
jgi:hypothetical protein